MNFMPHQKTNFIAYILILIICFPIKAQETIDTSDLIIIKSPSKNYNDILLQSHNGLPRFGKLNNYLSPSGKTDQDSREKSKVIRSSYFNYMGLIQMDYMKAMYNDFNKEQRVTTSNTKKEENAYKAQQHFSKFSPQICTEEAGNINAGTNEFERRRNYKDYVSNNLDGLRKWSTTILKNNTVTSHWVNIGVLKDYDFDKKGYWIYLALASGPIRSRQLSPHYILFSNYIPKNSYESKLLTERDRHNRTQPLKVLFKIAPEDAEKLNSGQAPKTRGASAGNNNFYMVAKIKTTLKKFQDDAGNKQPEIPKFEHHFASSIITLYKDAALTQKIGEISLDNLITE